MKHRIMLSVVLFAMTASYGQKVGSIDREELLELLKHNNDTVYVVNFWATWCSPCVAEIGYFEALHRALSDNKLKVVLVNLDFPNQVERRVVPFMEDKGLTALILNMTEMDYNSWIPDVDTDWSGAIPATLIFRGENREFIGRELSKEELFKTADSFLTK